MWDRGIELIAGVDEVGRGALAGPMVVGAVILKPADLFQVHKLLTNNDVEDAYPDRPKIEKYLEIKDSKLLSAKKREELNSFILQNCLCYGVFQVENTDIDTKGISACTQIAFSGAVKSLSICPEHILTDAFPIREFPQAIQTNITSGDKLSITIAAASIVAKVFRDKLMCDLGKLPNYAMYGFEKHKGYGTKLHFERLAGYGVSAIHRRTFIHST